MHFVKLTRETKTGAAYQSPEDCGRRRAARLIEFYQGHAGRAWTGTLMVTVCGTWTA